MQQSNQTGLKIVGACNPISKYASNIVEKLQIGLHSYVCDQLVQ